MSSNTCDACHSTLTWAPAVKVDHNEVQGSCTSCHDGNIATGKNPGHFITTVECDSCHSPQSWLPSFYTHTGAYPGDHRQNLDCTDCHTSNNEVIPWQFPYQPDCAGCHANRYKQKEHKKTKSPTTIYYTVDELRDCAGSCHEYTDDTFTTIKKTRNGEHRVNDSSFD